MMRRLMMLAPLCCCWLGCGSDEPASVFEPGIEQLVIEVDYQTGAEPCFDVMHRFSAWQLLQANARALVGGDLPLTIPETLDDTDELAEVTASRFTTDDILDIAARHRDQHSGTTSSFYVVFLDGRFEDEGEVKPEVLGVSIGTTGVIALFKPVIDSVPSADRGLSRAYVEQSTLVHEFGHAVGLVDNGLPTTSEHLDTSHGAHCSNPDCVMHYLNEGLSELASFVKNRVQSGEAVIFDDACLQDAHAGR